MSLRRNQHQLPHHDEPRFSKLRFGSTEATIYFREPRRLSDVTIRPYQYNFGTEFCNSVAESADMRRSVGHGGNPSDDILQAVLPSAYGIDLDVNYLDDYWTFTLVIDREVRTDGFGHKLGGPSKRFIASGYVINDEPMNLRTNSLNLEHAALQFLHSAILTRRTETGARGSRIHHEITDSADITANNVEQYVRNTSFGDEVETSEGLFMIDPSTLRNIDIQRERDGSESVMTKDGTPLRSIGSNERNISISTDMSAPAHQTRNLVQSLQSALDFAEDTETLHSGLSSAGAFTEDSSYDSAIRMFDSNLAQLTRDSDSRGFQIDTNVPIMLSQLLDKYPNIKVVHLETAREAQWDVAPQHNPELRNVVNSIIAGSMNAIAPGLGFATISFEFDSSIKDQDSGLKGIYNIEPDGTSLLYCNASESDMIGAIKQFKRYFFYDCVPIIRSIAGEFNCIVSYDMSNEILIDTALLDQGDDLDTFRGYYEHQNRLGGMITPSIGQWEHLVSNSSSLEHMTNNLCARKLLGHSGFTRASNVVRDTDQGFTGALHSPRMQSPRRDVPRLYDGRGRDIVDRDDYDERDERIIRQEPKPETRREERPTESLDHSTFKF